MHEGALRRSRPTSASASRARPPTRRTSTRERRPKASPARRVLPARRRASPSPASRQSAARSSPARSHDSGPRAIPLRAHGLRRAQAALVSGARPARGAGARDGRRLRRGGARFVRYHDSIDPTVVGSGIADEADRLAVVARFEAYLQVLDVAKSRAWPLGVATLVLGTRDLRLRHARARRQRGREGRARAAHRGAGGHQRGELLAPARRLRGRAPPARGRGRGGVARHHPGARPGRGAPRRREDAPRGLPHRACPRHARQRAHRGGSHAAAHARVLRSRAAKP